MVFVKPGEVPVDMGRCRPCLRAHMAAHLFTHKKAGNGDSRDKKAKNESVPPTIAQHHVDSHYSS
jgi:hypothetical protein